MVASNLQYKYSKGNTEGDDPKLRGEPDRSLFNRNEKHEVIYLIGKFVSKHGISTVESIQKTERMIQEHLPGNIREQSAVVNWLEINWRNYA